MNYISYNKLQKQLIKKPLSKESFMQFLKKLSVQQSGLKITVLEQAAADHKESPVAVLRVVGIVSGKSAGQSQYGPYIKFQGEFSGVNLLTGEEYRAPGLLLPAVGEAAVNSLYERAAKTGGTAEIALDVTVEYNDSKAGGTKFRYGVKPLIEFKGEDVLSRMLKALPPPSEVKKAKK
jgi:hypothetical protein